MMCSSETRTFYDKYLQIQSKNCPNDNCIQQKKLKQQEKKVLEEKIRKSELGIEICKKVIEQKDQKIKDLQTKLIGGTSRLKNDTAIDQSIAYAEFADHFTKSQLCEFRSISFDKTKDCTFVSKLITAFYDPETLKTKSLTGISKTNIIKKPLTPEKVELIRSIYKKRIEYGKYNDRAERTKKFRQYVNGSIQNISKASSSLKINKNSNNQINVIISNSENDLLVFKQIAKDMLVGDLKVIYQYNYDKKNICFN